MTFTQLEYIVALDTYRQFTLASQHCFITQPTLSMQIQKLEEELGITIFDRTKQPIAPTETGKEIIAQAKIILSQKGIMHELVQSKKGVIAGELKLGIIPTLAPYLLPLFIQRFSAKYKQVKLVISEMTTDNVIKALTEGSIDAGILVTPLQKSGVKEYPLFYEELVAYVSRKNALYEKSYVLAQDIDPNKLWLLEEGHCFRSQIENLCELRKMSNAGSHFDYETGSIETLRRMVDLNDGITILPELATIDMPAKQLQLIRHFKKPVPMREVSLIVQRDFVKKRLIDALKEEIIKSIPDKVKNNQSVNVVPIKN